jgi:epoxyqueuosine reductase
MAEKVLAFESIADALDLPARDGTYDRELCNIRMEKDISESKRNTGTHAPIRYCRKCEFACPIGK